MSDSNWATSIYEAIVYLGLNPHHMVINYTSGDHDGTAAIAFVDEKVAVCFHGNNKKPLVDDGWTVIQINLSDASSFGAVWESLKSLKEEVAVKKSAAGMLKTGSKEEQLLLREIIRAGLPEPDRNYRFFREDGKELTVPDFTWPEFKLAFFVDGLWWHVGKDNREKKQALLKADKKTLKEIDKQSQSRRERDTSNRSELQIRGWRVLECTDTDLATKAGARKQVEKIRRMIETLKSEEDQDTPQEASEAWQGASEREVTTETTHAPQEVSTGPESAQDPLVEPSEEQGDNSDEDLFLSLANL